jgi:TP901 family phage tail tape measure protein
MADIESNINLDIDASGALASLKELQRQISVFQTTMAKTGSISNARLSDMQNNLVNNINATGQFTASIQRVKTTTESFTQALEKNKLSMGQYFRYSLGATKTFGKGFQTEFDTIEKVARERVKTLQTQYIKLGRDASGAMQAIAVRPQVLDMKDLGTQTAIAAQKAQLFNQLMQQGSTNLLNFGKNTQWAGRQLMVGFTIPLGIMGAAAAKEFQKIEEQVIRLERVYGDFTTTMADTQEITQNIKGLADEFTKYGVAVSKTIGLAADAAAMGSVGADLVAQVAEANRLAVLGSVDQAQALETAISLTSAFGVAAEDLAKKTDFLNAVENQTITSIQDLTEAIPKAGPVVQQLGGNVEDLTFFLTAMREGGINASESANALKSGLASLINPTEEASNMLASFGINLQGIVEANKGNVKGVVIDFAKALDTLDPLNRAQAIEQLFGKFQFSRLSTLFQNVIKEGSQASRVLQLTQSSAAELASLSERELGRVEASPLFQFQGAIERFRAALAPVGEEFMKAVTPIINFGTDLLNAFNNLEGGAKQFAVVAVGAIGAIGPVLLMTFGLLANGLANIVKGVLFVRNGFKGVGDQSNVLTEQLGYMNSEQLQAAAISASLNQVHNNLIQTFTAEASSVRNLASAYGAAIAQQGAFMGPITTRGGGMKKPKGFASGGLVPGSGNGDTVPAMLTPGEFVLTKDIVKKYPETISGMVSGQIAGFNGGGLVTKGYTNAVSFMPASINQSLKDGLQSRSGLMSSLQSGGSAMYAPLIHEIAMKLGATNQSQVAKMLKENPELIQYANKLSQGIMDGVSQGVGDVSDAEMSKVTQNARKKAEKGLSPEIKKAAAEVFSEITTVEDTSGYRIGSGGKKRTKGRMSFVEGVTSYKSRKKGYQRTAMDLQGTIAQDDVMAHLTEAKRGTVEKLAGDRKLTETAKRIFNIKTQELKEAEKTLKSKKEISAATEKEAAATTTGSAFVRNIEAERTQTNRPRRAATGQFTALPANYLQTKLAEQKKQQRAERRAERMAALKSAVTPGRLGMTGMVAGGALSAASMMGGPAGDIAGQIGGPLMAVSGIASVLGMIPGPAGLVIGALGGVAAGLMFMNAEAEKAKQASRDQANAFAITAKNMDALAAAAGTVNPLATMTSQRTEAKITGVQDTTFGESYLSQEAGAAMADGMVKAIEEQSTGAAAKKMATQLSTAVASGILSPDQAESIALALGDKLKSKSFGINVVGEMTQIIGVNGEDLSKDPMKITLDIIKAGEVQAVQGIKQATIPGAQEPVGQGQMEDWSRQAAIKLQQEKIRNNSVDIISDFNSMQQQNQMLLAAQDLQNQQVVDQLMAEGKIEEAKRKQLEYDERRKVLTDQIAASTKNFTDQLKGLDAESRNILVRESAAQAKEVFKGTDQEASANKAIDALSGGRASAEAKLTLNAELASGTLTPDQLNTVFGIFDQKTEAGGKAVNLLADINAKLGSGVTSDIANLLPMFGDDEVAAKNFLTTFKTEGADAMAETTAMFTELQKINPELNMSIYFDGSEEAEARLKALTDAKTKMDELVANGPTTIETVISQVFKDDPQKAAAMRGNAEWFASLPAAMQSTFIQAFITAKDEITGEQIDAEINKTMQRNKMGFRAAEARAGSSSYRELVASQLAATRARTIVEQYQAALGSVGSTNSGPAGNVPPPSSGGSGGGGAATQPEKAPTSFLDAVVKDMRQFTTATQGLTENFQDSMNAIRNSSASAFGGLSQQLRGVGVGEDVISIMTGMSKEEWDQYKGQFFNFDAAGNVTGFKADLTAIADKLRTITLGKFVDEQQKSLVNLAAQNKALTSLVGLGMSYANAYKLIEDAALAAAIANAKSADEIRRIIALAEQARKAQSVADASKSVASANATTDATLAGLNALIKFNGALTDTQTAAILADNDLQTMLANFDTLTVDQLKVLNEALQDAADKEALEIKIKMQTKEGMQELFNDGFSKAMEQFSANEQSIKIKFEALKNPFEDIISSFSDQIEDLKNTPGGLDDLEADLQRIGEQEIDINKKYDERYKALDSIAKINDRVAAQQRTQLSLAEALSQGDIAAAARAAEEMRANDAAQALVDQREALQKSQQLEIDNLTANMGLTREQLEARIRDIKRQIFEIEEQQIEPAERQIELLTRQEELQINALTVAGKTREEWDAIKNNIEVAKTNSQQYNEAINLALGVVEDLQKAWKEVEKPKETIHTIIEKRISEAEAAARVTPPPAPAPVASTAPAPSGPVKDDAWVTSMARRVIRGEFGNGQARRNALGGDYQMIQDRVNRILYQGYASGGLVANYMASGGLTKPMFGPKGTDTVPAMLTPGEFVVRKWAVDRFGVENLKAVNQGNFGSGSVYNYNMSVNVRSDANPDEIARTVMAQIKRVDAQRIRGNRF